MIGRRLCHRLCHGALCLITELIPYLNRFSCCQLAAVSDTDMTPSPLYSPCQGLMNVLHASICKVAAGCIFLSKKQDLDWTWGQCLLMWSGDTEKSFPRQRNHSWIAKVQQVWARNSGKSCNQIANIHIKHDPKEAAKSKCHRINTDDEKKME